MSNKPLTPLGDVEDTAPPMPDKVRPCPPLKAAKLAPDVAAVHAELFKQADIQTALRD